MARLGPRRLTALTSYIQPMASRQTTSDWLSPPAVGVVTAAALSVLVSFATDWRRNVLAWVGVVLLAGASVVVTVVAQRLQDRRSAVSRRSALGDVLPLHVAAPPDPPGPSWLLSANNQVATFRGRRQEQELLQEWLTDAEAPPVLLLVGPAGVGKTRLIVHLASRYRHDWTMLRIGSGSEAGLVETLLACSEATVVVLDLKAPHHDPVALLRDVRRAGGLVKVLIECRTDAWRDTLPRQARRARPRGA